MIHSKRLAGDGDFTGYCYLQQMYDIGITAVVLLSACSQKFKYEAMSCGYDVCRCRL